MTTFSWVPGEPRFLELGRLRLEAAVFGPPPQAAPTIVLLHEGLGSAGLWRDFPARLAAATGFGALAYSRAGYGRSSPIALPRPLDYMTREAVETLPRVLDAVGVERLVLVGHSDGGSIALIFGGEAPVTGVVTLAAHLFVEDICIHSIERIRDRYVDGDLRERMERHHDDPDAAFWGWCGVWLDPAFREWTLDLEASAVTAPTLVIQGRDDPYGTLAQVDRICAAVGESAQRLVVPGGHSPHFDAAGEVVEAIGEFCSALP